MQLKNDPERTGATNANLWCPIAKGDCHGDSCAFMGDEGTCAFAAGMAGLDNLGSYVFNEVDPTEMRKAVSFVAEMADREECDLYVDAHVSGSVYAIAE